jgi:flagellar protein FliO/FliZ
VISQLLIVSAVLGIPMSPDSLAANWSTGPSWWQFIKVLFFLGLILALIWIVLNGLRKVGGRGGGNLQGVEIVGGLPLGPRRSLVFVKVGSAVYIIGATDHHLSSIGEITDPEVVKELTSGERKIVPVFGDLLRRATGSKGRV